MNIRITDELALLRCHYDSVEYVEDAGQHWFKVSGFRTPERWTPRIISVAFSVTQGYPEVVPYGFYVPQGLTHGDNVPFAPASSPPPFSGGWAFLSWQPVGWRPTQRVTDGSNLWAWVRSFRGRLQEGP